MNVFGLIAVAACIAFLLAWLWAEEDDSDMEALRWRTSIVDPLMLPAILLADGIAVGVLKGPAVLEGWLTAVCVDYTLLLTVYDALLAFLLPALRRYYRARTCALLWILPNFLYVTEWAWVKRPMPRLIVHLPETALHIGLMVWLLGTLGVFLWKMIQHFRFRKQILRGSYPVSAQDILEMWKEMQLASGLRKPWCRLLIAPETKTPLTFGLSPRRTRVLLPEREYTEDELRLILRHELVHIRRSDLSAKLFYVFTKSIGWFNPLVWLSLRRSADDLELSCDEAVLLGESEDTRRQYAELLLRTAGDERGITSCLSANAKALKHRLSGVMLPKKKHHGWLLIGVCTFLLLAGKGLVGVSYGETTVGNLLDGDVKIKSATIYSSEFRNYGEFVEEKALMNGGFLEALKDIPVEMLGGNYSLSSAKGRELVLVLEIDGRLGSMAVSEGGLLSFARSLGRTEAEIWYLPEGAEGLFSLYAELTGNS